MPSGFALCFWLPAVLNFVIKYVSSIVQNRFAIDSPGDWLKLLSPLSHPIRSWSSWRDLCACVSPLLAGYINWISEDKCHGCEKGVEILKQLSEESVAKSCFQGKPKRLWIFVCLRSCSVCWLFCFSLQQICLCRKKSKRCYSKWMKWINLKLFGWEMRLSLHPSLRNCPLLWQVC